MSKIIEVVEALRIAMMEADGARLADLAHDDLSYGHANGVIEDKEKFIDSIVSRRNDYQSIELTDEVITENRDAAIVRHGFKAEVIVNGVLSHADIQVMQVWQQKDGVWKLLARQAFKV